MKKINTVEMEIALASHFDFIRNIIVPGVSWGMSLQGRPLHECDLLICTTSGYLYEVEIKASKADLIADKKKVHAHHHPAIKRLYFAYPAYLEDCEDHLPERAGIITTERTVAGGIRVREARKPENNMRAKPLQGKERMKLARLGALRIWGLKKKLIC